MIDKGYEGVETGLDDVYSQQNGKSMYNANLKTGAIGSLNPSFEDPFIKTTTFKEVVNAKSKLAQSSSSFEVDSKLQGLQSARQKATRSNTQKGK